MSDLRSPRSLPPFKTRRTSGAADGRVALELVACRYSPMPLSSGSRLGPYEIVAAIGAGGMGEVYRARDTRLGRDVAVKVLPAGLATDDEARGRFEREARTISQLNHPHICVLHDIGRLRPELPASSQSGP